MSQSLRHWPTRPRSPFSRTVPRGARTTVGQFRHALNSRVTIEQAKGILSEREGITTDEAFARLRAAARKHHLKLSGLAASVVERSVPEVVLADLAPLATEPKG